MTGVPLAPALIAVFVGAGCGLATIRSLTP